MLDTIFEEHLHEWARGRDGQKLPIVFYAHGGLTSEQAGLLTAEQAQARYQSPQMPGALDRALGGATLRASSKSAAQAIRG
jgi:hypothetical protein